MPCLLLSHLEKELFHAINLQEKKSTSRKRLILEKKISVKILEDKIRVQNSDGEY